MVLPVIAAASRTAASGAVRGAKATARGGAVAGKGSARNATVIARNTTPVTPNSGVQNASVIQRTVTSDFLEGKDLSSQVRRRTNTSRNKRRRRGAEESGGQENDFYDQSRDLMTNTNERLLQNAANTAKRGLASNLPQGKMGSLATKRSGTTLIFSIAGTCSFFQFIFGIMALVFIVGGHYDIAFGLTGDAAAEFMTTTAGAAVEAAVNFVGFFFGFSIDLPPVTFSGIGTFLWGVNLAILLGGYSAIAIIVFFTNKELLSRTGIQLTLFCCVAADFIFGVQIFPWMLLFATVIFFSSVVRNPFAEEA